jgi:hypothetical protein
VKAKTEQIRAAWAAGDRIGALRIAAQFFDRSVETKILQRGMAAHQSPGILPADWEESGSNRGECA